MTTKTMECPKCQGAKHFTCWSGIAGGVCFRCGGTGVVAYRKSVAPRALDPEIVRKIEWVLKADRAAFAGLSYGQLTDMDKLCHWPHPGYPQLINVWRAVGREFFFAAQAERLSQLYA